MLMLLRVIHGSVGRSMFDHGSGGRLPLVLLVDEIHGSVGRSMFEHGSGGRLPLVIHGSVTPGERPLAGL